MTMSGVVDENGCLTKTFGPTEAGRNAFLRALRESASPVDVPVLLRDVVAGEPDVPMTTDAAVLADAWNAFGDVLFNRSGEGFLAAEHAYRMALATDPGRPAAFRGLGECLARHKRLDEARLVHDVWFACWIAGEGGAEMRRRQDARLARSPILFVAMQKSASEYIRDTLVEARRGHAEACVAAHGRVRRSLRLDLLRSRGANLRHHHFVALVCRLGCETRQCQITA